MRNRWRRRIDSSDRGKDSVRVTMRESGRNYSPTSAADFFFLHGLALVAARHALREPEPLYVPRDWDESS